MTGQARGRSNAQETVLLVDDEEAVRLVAERILSRAGYRVLCAGDALEALRVVEASAEPIDILLTDVHMPGLRGTELARRLRAARPRLRVLVMSGYAEDSLAEAGDSAWLFLEKPFAPDALLLKVRQAGDSAAAA